MLPQTARRRAVCVQHQVIVAGLESTYRLLRLGVLLLVGVVVQVIGADVEHHGDGGRSVQILKLEAGQLHDCQIAASQLLDETDRGQSYVTAEADLRIRAARKGEGEERGRRPFSLGAGNTQNGGGTEVEEEASLAGHLGAGATRRRQLGVQGANARSAIDQIESSQILQIRLPDEPAEDGAAPFSPQTPHPVALDPVADGEADPFRQ